MIMKQKLTHIILTVIALLFCPKINFGQAPDLGTTAGFAVFTATGAFGNSGTTAIRGNIGANTATPSGFPPGIVDGIIYQAGDGAASQAATDVALAYSDLLGVTCDTVIGTTLGSGQVLDARVYCLGAASTLNGNLILDGQGDSNALFIFKIDGALLVSAFSSVTLINSASICNVYWQVNGEFELADSSVFRGTVINNGAINLLEGSSLEGRALSIGGAVLLNNNIIKFVPDSATIIGTPGICEGTTGVSFSVPPINNATSYVWILPLGASIVSGNNTNSITVDFSIGASSGYATVYGLNPCGDGIASPNYTLTVWLLPLTSAIYHQ
jgi:hypothetical protein